MSNVRAVRCGDRVSMRGVRELAFVFDHFVGAAFAPAGGLGRRALVGRSDSRLIVSKLSSPRSQRRHIPSTSWGSVFDIGGSFGWSSRWAVRRWSSMGRRRAGVCSLTMRANIGTAGARVRDARRGLRVCVVTCLRCWRVPLSVVSDCIVATAVPGRATTQVVSAGISWVSGIRRPRSRTGAAVFAAIRQ